MPALSSSPSPRTDNDRKRVRNLIVQRLVILHSLIFPGVTKLYGLPLNYISNITIKMKKQT